MIQSLEVEPSSEDLLIVKDNQHERVDQAMFSLDGRIDNICKCDESRKKVRVSFKSFPPLTEGEARRALEEYVFTKCFYGKKPIHSMSIISLQTEHAYKYVLQTFTETSTTSFVTEPYLDGSFHGLNRCYFEEDGYTVKPRNLFKNEVVKAEVPNTTQIKNCDSCGGLGEEICLSCHGKGKIICYACIGTGRIEEKLFSSDENYYTQQPNQQSCFYCYGKGFTSCYDCRAHGTMQCFACKGSGKIKSYIQLIVKFENGQDECLKKPKHVPEQLIRNCQGRIIYSEQGERVNPINNHPDLEINLASNNLIDFHFKKFSNKRIIAQCHEIYVIPVTLCKYSYSNEIHEFYICGLDQQVYAPDYPEKCFCCCSIL